MVNKLCHDINKSKSLIKSAWQLMQRKNRIQTFISRSKIHFFGDVGQLTHWTGF